MMPLTTVPLRPPLLGELLAIAEAGGPVRQVGQARAGGMAMFTTGFIDPFHITDFDCGQVASAVAYALKADARQRSYFVFTYDLLNGSCLVTFRSYLLAEEIQMVGSSEARALVSAWVRTFTPHVKAGDE